MTILVLILPVTIMLTTRPNWNTFNDDVLATLRCKDKTLGCLCYKKILNL